MSGTGAEVWLDPLTPVLVGAGAASQRHDDPADALEASALMRLALDRAATDAGFAGLGHRGDLGDLGDLGDRIDEIIVAEGIWGYTDPGRSILEGRSPRARSVLAAVGVLQQTMFTRACEQIAAGAADVVAVCGGEAKYRSLRALIGGVDAPETLVAGARPDLRLEPEDAFLGLPDLEILRGLDAPTHQYAVMESALRFAAGDSVETNKSALGAMMAGFSDVAATNPDAWTRTAVTPAEVLGAPMVATPYTKLCCAQWNVDQAAAFLLCSAGTAESLGIDRAQWVFPHLAIESNLMVPLTERAELHRSPAIDVAAEQLRAHGIDPDAIDHLEIYSCFPAAVRMQCIALGIALGRAVTVTGGMNFAGGPLNNFTLQALARIVELLRADPGSSALVTSLSGNVTKFGLGVWSTTPPASGFEAADVTESARRRTAVVEVDPAYEGPVTIAGFTVGHERGVPTRAVVIADTPAGTRAVATSVDPALVASLAEGEWCGRQATVTGELLVGLVQ